MKAYCSHKCARSHCGKTHQSYDLHTSVSTATTARPHRQPGWERAPSSIRTQAAVVAEPYRQSGQRLTTSNSVPTAVITRPHRQLGQGPALPTWILTSIETEPHSQLTWVQILPISMSQKSHQTIIGEWTQPIQRKPQEHMAVETRGDCATGYHRTSSI